ncbi:MAG: SAM domain-containing protein [Treponema sp.]|jgi:hypothetical protein|nr:SAM domain-containing protein [Treponema sp.]
MTNKIGRFFLSILYFIPLYPFWIGVVPYLLGNRTSGVNYIGASAFAIGIIFPYIIAGIYEKRGNSWWKIFLLSGFLSTGIPILGIIWIIISKINISKKDKSINYNEKNIGTISFNDINYKEILIRNGLDEYIELFEKNRLNDIKIIIDLTEDDYEKLGIELMGDRKKLLKIFSKHEITNYYFSCQNNEMIENKGQLKNEENIKLSDFEVKYLKEIENDKEIYKSRFFQLDYKDLLEKLLMNYPVSIRKDIENIENKHGIETAKKVIVKLLKNNIYVT